MATGLLALLAPILVSPAVAQVHTPAEVPSSHTQVVSEAPTTATASENPPYEPVYHATLLRLSPEIGERRAEIAEFVATMKGWAIGEPAEYEITPNPEFFQDLMFVRIKRAENDPVAARQYRTFVREAMDIADILDFHSGPNRGEFAWSSNVPYPVDLGAADGAELFGRMAAAMAPVARRSALLNIARNSAREPPVTCISNEASSPGWCPMPATSDWSALSAHRPLHIQVKLRGDSVGEFTTVAIAPDGSIRPVLGMQGGLFQAGTYDNGDPIIETSASNSSAAGALGEPGIYHFISFVSATPIDPRIWSIQPQQSIPADMCQTLEERLLCDAMQGEFDTKRYTGFGIALDRVMLSEPVLPVARMVGGQVAGRADGKWQAQLFLPDVGPPLETSGRPGVGRIQRLNFEKAHKCGGSYIAPGIILTAAHCVSTRALNDLQVRLGTLDIANGGSNFPIESIVIHEGYGKAEDNADIAIIRIRTDARLDRLQNKGMLGTIALAPQGRARLAENTPLMVTGWGFTGATEEGTNPLLDIHNRTQRNSQDLMKLTIASLDPGTCARYRQFSSYNPQDIICARSPIAGRDACYGDSGGPLSRQAGRSRQLVGIVAAGIGCAQSNYPGVYTRVASYREWIDRAISASRVRGIHRIP
ncbi:serine protease [Altererythrobacter arenosus]|uniref:Serine protease n=1 Tax=Altererythrobacter arenosus TaxID=3032592 RepID=A0ABY8FTU5_9SPHN|nr:serine protease [Altererythrobacter sp. CAU 1644]WFL78187.1 serine protease [Altererythrobacter sp. CAU 1644]